MIASSIGSLLGERAATTIDPLHPRDPGIVKLFGLGAQSKTGVRVTGDTVLGIPAVLRGVNIISNAVMKVRPIVYRRLPGHEEDRERAKEHASWRFVTRRANPLMSAGFFRKQLTAWAILRGNGLAHLERDVAGRIVEAIPLLPDRSGMAIFRNGAKLAGTADVQPGDVIRYWTIVGGEVRRLLPENVIHIKGLSHNGYWGIDIVEALCESFGLSIAPRDYSAQFYGQGATPSAVVFAPTGLRAEQQKDFAERIQKGAQGLGKAHRLMILEETAKYQQIAIDPEKAALLKTREFERVEVADIIGIQPHKIGDSSRVAYNSLEQSNQEHLDDDLDPHLQTWEDELSEKCLTEEEKRAESHFVEFNRDSLVRVNMLARTQRDTFERTHGLATANRVLRRSNQAPIGPVGDTYMVPANMTLLDSQGVPVLRGQAAPATPPPADREDKQDAAHEGYRELALYEVERLARRATGEAVRQAKQGGAAFLAFLDQLPAWSHQPARLAELLGAATQHVHERLNAFTSPPYSAADLQANVAAAAGAIIDETVDLARRHLENEA